MLRLNLNNKDARWIDLVSGVRLLVDPMSTSVMMAARGDPAVQAAAEAEARPEDETIAVIVAKAVAHIVVQDWEGIGDEAGEPLAVTPDNLDALLDLWPMFEAFQTRYIAGGLVLEQEKNG